MRLLVVGRMRNEGAKNISRKSGWGLVGDWWRAIYRENKNRKKLVKENKDAAVKRRSVGVLGEVSGLI